MTVGITAEGLGDAITAAGTELRTFADRRKDKQWLKKCAEQIDEMLRNPAHPFRQTSRIGAVLDDRSEDFAETRAILRRLQGVRHNAGSADTWFRPANWQTDATGKLLRENGRGVLAKGMQPGTF